MTNNTTWILGLDLREGAEGPLVFARWLQSALGSDATLTAIHVIEADQLGLLASAEKREQARTLAADALAQTLERSGDTTPLANIEWAETGTPEDVLSAAAKLADGLILGRLAPRGKDRLLRLGGVARRLLRRLPAPTVVVPPDLGSAQIGKGPIILACDGRDDSLGAARFATRIAERLGRELLLAHIVPMPVGWSVGYLPPESLKQVRADLRASGERLLERWATQHGLSGHRGVVTEGIVPEELARLGEHEDALMIITGSRQLNAAQRLFVTSVGSELAACTSAPVAIVPADYQG